MCVCFCVFQDFLHYSLLHLPSVWILTELFFKVSCSVCGSWLTLSQLLPSLLPLIHILLPSLFLNKKFQVSSRYFTEWEEFSWNSSVFQYLRRILIKGKCLNQSDSIPAASENIEVRYRSLICFKRIRYLYCLESTDCSELSVYFQYNELLMITCIHWAKKPCCSHAVSFLFSLWGAMSVLYQ